MAARTRARRPPPPSAGRKGRRLVHCDTERAESECHRDELGRSEEQHHQSQQERGADTCEEAATRRAGSRSPPRGELQAPDIHLAAARKKPAIGKATAAVVCPERSTVAVCTGPVPPQQVAELFPAFIEGRRKVRPCMQSPWTPATAIGVYRALATRHTRFSQCSAAYACDQLACKERHCHAWSHQLSIFDGWISRRGFAEANH